MNEKYKAIFGNSLSAKDIKNAEKTKKKFLKKFGDDSNTRYSFSLESNAVLDDLGTKNLVFGDKLELPGKPVFVGNIRMGFGHYRISMAIASCVRALGYDPIWLDLNSFDGSACSEIIKYQNNLYSMGSRLSSKFPLFNKLYWEKLNSEGFRKLSYNAADQASAELMANLLKSLPKDVPYIATHVWPAQAAIHAGFSRVVDAIPDNWPMALHLSEGSIHTTQTYSSYLGYRNLRGMNKGRSVRPIPDEYIKYTGHYVDHEFVVNLEEDTKERLDRLSQDKPKRYLLTVGGAGAQQELFVKIINTIIPEVKAGKAVLFINVGDHKNVLDALKARIPELAEVSYHIDDYAEAKAYIEGFDGEAGINVFCDSDIFAAVYETNLLMRVSDVLITKPSELSFYPIPKLFIQHIGGHEVYGAIHSAEIGDGTYEVDDDVETADMLRLLQNENRVLEEMNCCILNNKKNGIYDGGYRVVRLAAGEEDWDRPGV